MPKPDIPKMIATITAATTVQSSAIVYIQSVPGLIQAAKDESLANGATEEELAPFTAVLEELEEKNAEIEAALLANTANAEQRRR